MRPEPSYWFYVLPVKQHFLGWAMLGSNQRPLPCEGSVLVCWRFLELAKFLQKRRFFILPFSQHFRNLLGLLHSKFGAGAIGFARELLLYGVLRRSHTGSCIAPVLRGAGSLHAAVIGIEVQASCYSDGWIFATVNSL